MKLLKSGMLFMTAVLFMMTTYSCGIKYNIKGRVVDSETGKPIEGAAVSLHWYDYQLLPRLTGMGSGFESLAVYESLTDANGYFETTYLLSGDYDLAVYKKGHVCWNSKNIFNPDPGGKLFKRTDYELKDGTVIKLELFKECYSRYEHARFIEFHVQSPYAGRIFLDAIAHESEIFYGGKK